MTAARVSSGGLFSPLVHEEATKCAQIQNQPSIAKRIIVVVGKIFATLIVLTVVAPLLFVATVLSGGKVWNFILRKSFLPMATTERTEDLYLLGFNQKLSGSIKNNSSQWGFSSQWEFNLEGKIFYIPYQRRQIGTNKLDVLTSEISKEAPTVILFCGNGARYESFSYNLSLSATFDYWKKGCNVIMFNYRSVGLSGGPLPQRAQDIVDDGLKVMEYATETLKIPKHQIILHGHSMGGAVATKVAEQHPEAHLYNERSFTKFSEAAGAQINQFTYLGSLVKAIISRTRWELDSIGAWQKRDENSNKGFTHFTTGDKDEVILEGARIGPEVEKHLSKRPRADGRGPTYSLENASHNGAIKLDSRLHEGVKTNLMMRSIGIRAGTAIGTAIGTALSNWFGRTFPATP